MKLIKFIKFQNLIFQQKWLGIDRHRPNRSKRVATVVCNN